MRKFYLITNGSGMKYWSYKVTRKDAAVLPPFQSQAVTKYGDIYVNKVGGWMTLTENCVIHEVVESENFPLNPSE